jgi:squalene-hopene/tetraprenyl-beta-curcumene cyclase
MTETLFGSQADEVKSALHRAANYSYRIQHEDGHWYGELKSNATLTSEYVMLRQALGLELESDRKEIIGWFLSEQNADGSWAIAPGHPGNISCSVESYLALKILGVQPDTAAMQKARSFIISAGGVAKVRIFSRIYLATFGLFPWTAIPELPAELILMPDTAFISIYRLASWARSTIVPLLIVAHHRPLYALPNGKSATNDFLDELWVNAAEKNEPYSPPLWELIKTDLVAATSVVCDNVLHMLGGLRKSPSRSYTLKLCLDWTLQHQEVEGDWGGIFPPMHVSILALTLEGYALEDAPVRKGLEAIERFSWSDEVGKRMQPCVSPMWDTILTTIGLCDANMASDRTFHAINWVKDRQIFGPEGDWRILKPNITAGGFSFEYFNRWYPDVDDTAAAILAIIKEDPDLKSSLPSIVKAVEWIIGMQNHDGGWGAFDIHNDREFLNKIPFSDMDALCDPSTADVTGRILEAFGLLFQNSSDMSIDLLKDMNHTCKRAIRYLLATQEMDGSWYGRWGSNYIYGTSNVVCGLTYFTNWGEDSTGINDRLNRALAWLSTIQNPDGGWGETLFSYKNPDLAGKGPSTPSQTGWALMALLAHNQSHLKAIERGVKYLLQTQTKSERPEEASWPESLYTGTGFPNHFYIGYTLYSHYFPMMALGRYIGVNAYTK